MTITQAINSVNPIPENNAKYCTPLILPTIIPIIVKIEKIRIGAEYFLYVCLKDNIKQTSLIVLLNRQMFLRL